MNGLSGISIDGKVFNTITAGSTKLIIAAGIASSREIPFPISIFAIIIR